MHLSFTIRHTINYSEFTVQSSICMPPLDPGLEAVLDVEDDGDLGLHGVPGHRLHLEVPHHGGRHRLELHERHVLAEARPRAGVEGHELVRRHVPRLAVLPDPPLRPELPAVLAPHRLHPPHRVQRHHHLVPRPHLVPARQRLRGHHALVLHRHRRVQPERLAQRRVQVRQPPQLVRVVRHHAVRCGGAGTHGVELREDLGHHARVPREEVEEPGEPRAGRVAAGQHEVHGRVAEEGVDDRARFVVVVDVGGEQVGRVFDAASRLHRLPPLGDRLADEPVDVAPRDGHLPLVPDPEPPHQLPPRRREHVADEEHVHGVVHGASERHLREADGQAARVDAEHQRGRRVERQPEEHVLQVAHAGAAAGDVGEQREQVALDLAAAAPCHEGPEPGAGHEKLRLGALAAPGVAVGVEDAAAEDVHDLGELGALGVVGEVGGENVADVGRIGGEEELHAGARRADEAEVERAGGEQGGDPVVEAREVGEERREHAHQRPLQRDHRVLPLGPGVEVVEDDEAEQGERELEEGDERHFRQLSCTVHT
ncbi:hypothetical protein VPH35_080094 [Triticum aestivum]